MRRLQSERAQLLEALTSQIAASITPPQERRRAPSPIKPRARPVCPAVVAPGPSGAALEGAAALAEEQEEVEIELVSGDGSRRPIGVLDLSKSSPVAQETVELLRGHVSTLHRELRDERAEAWKWKGAALEANLAMLDTASDAREAAAPARASAASLTSTADAPGIATPTAEVRLFICFVCSYSFLCAHLLFCLPLFFLFAVAATPSVRRGGVADERRAPCPVAECAPLGGGAAPVGRH